MKYKYYNKIYNITRLRDIPSQKKNVKSFIFRFINNKL